MATLEQLLTHPLCFGLTTASPVQRACCRVAEGLPLGELACDETVRRTFGGDAALASLPTRPPLEFYLLAAIRTGKSLFTGALAVHTALTIQLPFLPRHEKARVSVVSLDRDKAKIVMQHIQGAMLPGRVLRRYLMQDPKPTDEHLVLRRPDGRLVEIVVAAGRRGGASLVSRWTVAAIFDEAARMLGQEDGIVNFDDMYKAVIERLRLLRSQGSWAKLAVVSSPWAARGPVYETVEECWGHPSDNRVVVRATGPELNPVLWTPAAVEASRLDPRGSYENDVLGLFVDAENGWLSSTECKLATRAAPLERGREDGYSYTAAMDPATAGNAWTLVVVGRKADEDGQETSAQYHVALARQWQGTPGEPLKARTVFAEIAPLLREYRLSEVYSDRWGGSLLAEHGDYAGVTVHVARDSAEDVSRRHADFRTLLLDRTPGGTTRLELSPHPQLTADLLTVRKRLMPGGAIRYVSPVSHDGRHADFRDAVVLAVARAQAGPSWVDSMNMWARRGATL